MPARRLVPAQRTAPAWRGAARKPPSWPRRGQRPDVPAPAERAGHARRWRGGSRLRQAVPRLRRQAVWRAMRARPGRSGWLAVPDPRPAWQWRQSRAAERQGHAGRPAGSRDAPSARTAHPRPAARPWRRQEPRLSPPAAPAGTTCAARRDNAPGTRSARGAACSQVPAGWQARPARQGAVRKARKTCD